MSKVLYIKANPKADQDSRTFRLSERFIQIYKSTHPQDEVIMLDLYQEGIRPLNYEDIQVLFSPKDENSKNHPLLKYAFQFTSADKYIVAAPMWNLSFPAIFKCYIDYITVTDVTFKYTEEGPVGLLSGKKTLHIVTRGGVYTEGPLEEYEMGDRYLRSIFGFLGINDIDTVSAEMLDIQGVDVEAIMKNMLGEIEKKAKMF